jgi:beta-N-acetylhexosaminidase/D-alanyl-D-alanine dipeptidase
MGRKASLILVLAATLLGPAPLRASWGSELVDVSKVDPSIIVELRYATTNNFTGKIIYESKRAILRRDVAKRLECVQASLEERGLGLKLWDAYRPFSIQKRFYKLVPDDRYVARPTEDGGLPVDGSKHNRGAAVDVTLVDLKTGRELEMPTLFDDFSRRAHRDYEGCSAEAKKNRKILEDAMTAEGFEPMPTEWWHFDGPGWQKYGISEIPVAP